MLAKQSTDSTGSEELQLDVCSTSDVGTEEEEIDIEDVDNSMGNFNMIKTSRDESICLLICVCLENISNKVSRDLYLLLKFYRSKQPLKLEAYFILQTINTPVRLQSLKLVGRLAFNMRNLVFPHLERVTTTLISVMDESESQIVLHACRALEIMSGCLANIEIHHSDGILFWDIIFEPIISLSQTSETILREAACDCLGSMSENVFTQLPVRKPERNTIIQVSIRKI